MQQSDDTNAAAMLAALRIATEQGSATAALSAAGIELPNPERFGGISEDYRQLLGQPDINEPLAEALALGFLAGRVAHRKRHRTLQDPTSFLMDRELVVLAAEGESILRLPWFDDELFVGRDLPHIPEIPTRVRTLAVENYRIALAGERTEYAFTSYGHAYTVDAIPVRNPTGRVEHVMAIARPGRSPRSAAVESERVARRMDLVAARAEQKVEVYRRAGCAHAARVESQHAEGARQTARRARINAQLLRQCSAAVAAAASSLTRREQEVLTLASHGLSYVEIAEQLVVTNATVKTHFANIYKKLSVRDKAAAVAAALRYGLID